ncbi:spore coat protein JB [Mesobacillus persicus]|uniref:Spore coat protein JB n=1 Tax=Mesobacillus persicus TaxID=930146 RepID=A0A1H8EKI5_9BACI|nr:spore coat protein CotJB [Mesobacillus persicus]SEN19995.1 spore coat protein JB [Mesobacillus persicus]
MKQKQLPQDYYQRLEEIQAIDFAIVELNLYLDTHPQDQAAIQQYNQYAQYSKKLKKEFEARYGSLQNYGNSYSDGNWSWGSAPWPWQV